MNGYGDQFTEDPRVEADMHKKQADTELANMLVAIGVGEYEKSARAYSIRTSLGNWAVMSAQVFVRDWRVAGATMEKCEYAGWIMQIENSKRSISLQFLDATKGQGVYYTGEVDTPLALAINEAGTKALTTFSPENASSM